MQMVMMYGSVLASSLGGKGAVFTDACEDLPLIFVSGKSKTETPSPSTHHWIGLLALAFGILNVALMIVAFDAYRRMSIVSIGSVVALHMAAGLVVSTPR